MAKVLCSALLALAGCTAISYADETHNVAIGNINFTVANGMRLEQVADESLIQWPIAATFHPEGDLLVLECHWNRESVQKQLESKPHKIVRLSDSHHDGKYDTRRVIADELGFPEGIMVLGSDLLVTTPPHIMKLSDKDKDGFFETKEIWFDATTLTHCANDLHGPMMGPDGWVYWTKGAFAEQKHPLIDRTNPDKETSAPSKAAHIYRRHPSGGPIERLMTGGMDNPSDLTFSPEGERFFCSTFLHHPGNGLRDGIGHAPRGGLFGKQHQVLDGHWSTGPLLQPIANLGPAAPASVHFLDSKYVLDGTQWERTPASDPLLNRFLVTSQFNLHKVGLHRLVPKGSSFETENYDLLSADRVDFHPVDVLEDELNDGLLVFDTGGWYDLCCPSSGTDQKVAKGGIYLLRSAKEWQGTRKKFGSWQADREPIESDLLLFASRKFKSNPQNRYIWQFARALTASPDKTELSDAIVDYLSDPEPTVRQAAAHIVGLNRWKRAEKPLIAMLASDHAPSVRSAMEALGVVGSPSCLKPILAAMEKFPEDRLILHSGIYTMMEIGDRESLVSIAIETKSNSELYATVYALNQLGSVQDMLFPRLVQSLSDGNGNVRGLAIECLSKSPVGTALCIPFLESAWEREDADQLAASLSVVQSCRTNAELLNRLAQWLHLGPSLTSKRQAWLQSCLQQVASDRLPAEWCAPLESWIKSSSNEDLAKIATAIRKAKYSDEDRVKIADALRGRAESILSNSAETTLTALAACPNLSRPLSSACGTIAVEQLIAPESKLSSLADAAISKSIFSLESAQFLVGNLDKVPSLYLQTAIDALLRSGSPEIDQSLINKLPQVPAIKTLTVEKVLASVSGRSEEFKKQWAAMMQAATRPPENIADELDAWLKRLPAGDAKRGYQVFSNKKAACSSCHQIGYVGGRLGPELSSIGRTRSRRDLIEAIVYPSLRIAQGYSPTRIRTADDEVYNGLLSRQTETYVELLCGVDRTCRIEKSDIEEQSESKVSVMPSGLDQQIALEDFADLLAFLESKR